jgi:hypothetical protein
MTDSINLQQNYKVYSMHSGTSLHKLYIYRPLHYVLCVTKMLNPLKPGGYYMCHLL